MSTPSGEAEDAPETATAGSADLLHAGFSADWTPDAPLTLVFLHGYGADELDLAPLGPMLALTVPWASLRAPVTLASGGYAWFPFSSLDGSGGGLGPDEATGTLWQWIDAYLAPDAKVAVVGFSQGGLMATQLLRTRPDRVAATVVLSGFVHAAPQPADERLAAERPAVFWGRGARDRMITSDAVQRTSQWLPAHSDLTGRVYPELAHGISDTEIDDVRTFLIGRLWGPSLQ